MEDGSSSVRLAGRERRDAERERRMRTKNLFLFLHSLIVPPNDSKKRMSINDLLDHTTKYIKQQEEKVEGMKKMKEKLQLCSEGSSLHEKIILVRDLGSALEVVFTNYSGCINNGSFLLGEIINIMKEEGAEVISASFHNVGGVTHHSIHCQEYCSRVGVETDRIYERLKELNKAAQS
ncbi:hypothetical protein Sjap_016058 [Stephania japonica]|uniref:BHLH domain-containing protein n=1 Tax=Stephania japonica TaxID=461633 RepID=A0AAP0IKA7_9MAGN